MFILGISCYYHDSAAVLLAAGRLIAAAEEEKFSRKKHDNGFPGRAIEFCLAKAGIKGSSLDYVVFYEKPFTKFERILKTAVSTYPKSLFLFQDTAFNWIKEKLWIKAKIAEFLKIPFDKVFFSSHHLSHAASSFFCSRFKKAAILTIDGVGEWTTTALGQGECGQGGGKISFFKELRFPHSLGLLYSVFTAYLGFKVNNGEYKVMGLSAFGEPVYKEEIYKLIDSGEDGSYRLNMDYFSYHYSSRRAFNKKFLKLFGPARKPEQEFTFGQNQRRPGLEEDKRFADIAASIQAVSEEVLVKIAGYLYRETKIKKLCLAGGVALNCKANYQIKKQTPFEEIYIQPAAGDAGGALGAALYLWHCRLKNSRPRGLESIFLGRGYTDSQIKDFFAEEGIKYREFKTTSEIIEYTAARLAEQKVIGWFQGRFEWGPRALGNRSILADPRDAKMKEALNRKIKFREPFRPFAPSVLEEYAADFFWIDKEEAREEPFRYMLYTVKAKSKTAIPAAVHIDGTSRIQIVRKKDNPLYYSLIRTFYEKTKIPLLLNTSFNLKGEPITDSPQNAYNSFRKSNIDLLIIDNFVIE